MPDDPSPTTRLRRTVALVRARWVPLAGWLAVAAFAVMVARFWHPYYGMTRLLQFDTAAAALAIHEVREQPVFVYREHGGYDGLYYAQIAYHPLLGSPELERALDNPGFRSRRILMSATAWLLAGGRAAWIADVFACLNIAAWFGLAALLWRVLAVRDARGWLAWASVLFSAGALHSVRQSLTDLPALLLVCGALHLIERGRAARGLGLVAAAALTRETSLLAAVGAWGGDWRRPRTWVRHAILGFAVALPLALWLAYVRHRFGPGDAGTSNFTWPLVGWLQKWPHIADEFANPAFHRLVTTTLLATIGVTAQAVFLAVHRRPADAWWRLGAVHVVMLLCLGRAVWEGHPGSFTRVLLPMTLAFAVCAVRWRASPAWLLVGGLTVFAGFEPWRDVVVHRDDLASGRVHGRGYLVELQPDFFPREARRHPARSWSSGDGAIELRFTGPIAAERLRVALDLRGFDARTVRIADARGEVWSGAVDTAWQPVGFSMAPDSAGRWRLRLTSPEPPRGEAAGTGARPLAFAIRDVRLGEDD